MAVHRLYLYVILFCLLQTILLFFNSCIFLKCEYPETTTKSLDLEKLEKYLAKDNSIRKPAEPTETLRQNYVAGILKRNLELEYENSLLRKLMKKADRVKNETRERAVLAKPLTRQKRRKKDRISHSKFEELFTIILYEEVKTNSSSCLEARKAHLQLQFPDINILFTNEAKTVGSTFNMLFPKVETKYFYFLNVRNEFFTNVDNDVYWLLQDLEEVQALDFISGSILDEDRLEIPCYRLHSCAWTFAQKYEYIRSIEEIMICDNIGSSFMGKTRSVREKKMFFDEKMKTLATTDFFFRAKKVGAVCGVHPEVIVKVIKDKRCPVKTTKDKLKQYQELLPFAHKHKVFRFKDSDSETLDLCGEESPILGTDICDEPIAHRIMLDDGHWAKDGTFSYPYIINNLQKCLLKVTDLLNSKGILFHVDAGVALGALKMRGILPWDAGDVDIGIYHDNPFEFVSIIESFAKEHNYTFQKLFSKGLYQIYCTPGLGDKMGGLVSMFLEDEEPKELIKIKTNGNWVTYKREIFKTMRHQYGESYLQHVMYESNTKENMNCKIKGHNACLPDFRENTGNAGTYSELFCQI